MMVVFISFSCKNTKNFLNQEIISKYIRPVWLKSPYLDFCTAAHLARDSAGSSPPIYGMPYKKLLKLGRKSTKVQKYKSQKLFV